MKRTDFDRYLKQFEAEVILEGVRRGAIGKPMLVNVREGRFSCTKFARIIGNRLDFSIPFVVDYYGHIKRSNGFSTLIGEKEVAIRNRQIKSIETVVVFFASLKIEEIAAITNNTFLRSKFTEFKQAILHRRGFEKRTEKIMEK